MIPIVDNYYSISNALTTSKRAKCLGKNSFSSRPLWAFEVFLRDFNPITFVPGELKRCKVWASEEEISESVD